MKKLFNMRKSKMLLFTLLALIVGGVSPAWADELTIFENATTTFEGLPFYLYNCDTNGNQNEFVIPSSKISSLSGNNIIELKFYCSNTLFAWGTTTPKYKIYLKEVTSASLTAYSGDTDATSVYNGELSVTGGVFTITFTTPYEYNGGNLLIGTKVTGTGNYIAKNNSKFYVDTSSDVQCSKSSSGSGSYYLPKTTFVYESATVSGPALTVYDGSTKITTDYNYSFGLATTGTTKTFTLKNPGTEAVPISVAHTGNFGASLSATSIPAGESVTLNVTMPDASGSDVITISSTSDAIDDFVINVSGTVRDESKMWCNFSEGLPTGWTNSGNYTINTSGAGDGTSGGGYASETSYSYKLMYTPLVTIAEGEKIYLQVSGHGVTASWNEMQIRYSADASDWKTAKTVSNIVKDSWTSVEVTEIPAGNWYIGFYGRYVYFTDIYGGTESTAPVIALSQSSYDFGMISTSTTTPEAITITNTGKSALTGLNFISDNANFTVSVTDNATTIAANGGTATFNVTMAPNATGTQSATITIKSDNADDLTFTATGAVLKAGTTTALFNDESLAGWTKVGNTSFNSDETAAYFYYGTNTLTSSKLSFAADDFLAVKAKLSASYGYVTVKGSTDGTTFTEIKKLDSSVLNQTDYAIGIVSGISTDYKYIQLVGYYCYVKEVAGLTYVPELAVTTGNPAVAVSTPANYDFGQCKANASVTYNFANASPVGTISITDVAISGDGAAAYSTDWAGSTTAPFALTITRAYDVNRTEEQNAVVTVTTSEGDFVINVTGTDWAPITTFPWTENFNSITSGIPAGWDNAEGTTTTDSYKWSYYATGHDGAGLRFNSYNNSNGNTNILKTPIMNLPSDKDMQLKFWYKNPAGGDFSVYISNDGGETYERELASGLTGVSDWTEKVVSIPSDYTNNVVIVFKGTSNYGNGDAYIYFDDVSVQEPEDGANFAISDNAKTTKDFGRVKPNTVQEETYTITNSGNEPLVVNFTDASDFIVVKGETEPWNDGKLTVPAKAGDTDGTATFTVKMVTDGSFGEKSGDVVLDFTALNATSYTISFTGEVIDPTVLNVDFEDNAFPEGWQVGANWSVGSASSNHYAVQSQTSLANASAIVTTPLTFADNETLTFKVQRNLSGNSSYKKSLKVRYSTDGGVNWSDYKDYGDDFGSSFSQYELTDVPAGNVIVEFYGNNIKLDDIKGVKNATKPAIAVTESDVAVANGAEKDFGFLDANGTATYTVKNIGNATLNATISGDGITVSPANISVAAGETADIIVTLAYAEPYGNRSGMKMTIDSEDEWISDFVVNFTATLNDPTAFVEDFSGNTTPAGWYNGGWTLANQVASISLGTAHDLITKKVEAAEDKNVLTFKAKYSNENLSKTLNVYTSTDRMNWTLKKEQTLTADYVDVTLDALTDGEYYVKFEAANAIIDDVQGLKKVDLPDHDFYVSATTLPTGDNYVDAELSVSATVASLIADETGVYAKLFVDNEEVVAADAASIAANGTATFTMGYTCPAEAGSHTAKIVVYDSNNSAVYTSAESAFAVVNYPALVLDETSTEALSFTTGTYDITLNRNFLAGWNTVCLPFEVNVTDIDEGAVAYAFNAYSSETGELTFNSVTKLSPATPYIMYVPKAISSLVFKKQEVNSYYATASYSQYSGVVFRGTYAPITDGSLSGMYVLSNTNAKIMKASSSATLKGFRAYFDNPSGARLSIVLNDETQGIRTILTGEMNAEGIFNLQGQKVQGDRKGLYIINGKKVVRK